LKGRATGKGGEKNLMRKRRAWAKTVGLLLGLIFTVLIIGGFVSGCQQVKEKEKEKRVEKASVEFENPDLLVSTDWLEQHLTDEDIKIVDVRSEEDYKKGHIPGAVNLPVKKTVDADNPIPGMVAPKEKIEELLGNLGISNEDRVIVYDKGGTPFAGRVFWILDYYGHEKVSVLDGGIEKWQKDGRELSTEIPEVEKTTYVAKPDPSKNATKEQVSKWIKEKPENMIFVDTRPLSEWITGHLPDAVRLDWVELLTDDEPPLLKSAPELQKIFEKAGITKDKEVVLY
jgi:thiosulfate/3-mercaptopyruvate sulfurtransferase